MITLRPHQFDTVKAMWDNDKGQIIVPTGGGKTMCMIDDAISYLNGGHKTIVVVAPRILLAEQLSSEFLEIIQKKYQFINVLHVHSGETHHFSTTNVDMTIRVRTILSFSLFWNIKICYCSSIHFRCSRKCFTKCWVRVHC